MSIVLNEVYEEDGAIVFREACKLGCEGIVSTLAALGESQKPECASGEARGRGGLGQVGTCWGQSRSGFGISGKHLKCFSPLKAEARCGGRGAFYLNVSP